MAAIVELVDSIVEQAVGVEGTDVFLYAYGRKRYKLRIGAHIERPVKYASDTRFMLRCLLLAMAAKVAVAGDRPWREDS